jgi:hypothetical protein
MVNGEIISGGNEIRLVSGSQVNNTFTPTTRTDVPLPGIVPASLLLIGGLAGWRRIRHTAAA